MSLSTITRLSNRFGADADFVLAGGGNTSYKTPEYLYIKGSGTTLATITESGFVKMNRQKLTAMFHKTYPTDATQREALVLEDMMAAREPSELTKRPSVETLLHHLFRYTYVVHTHPALINGMTCGVQGKVIAEELLGDAVIWIDSIEPGYILASTLKAKMDAYKRTLGRDADIILLQNHGVFIAADDEQGIIEKTKWLFDKVASCCPRKPDFTPCAYEEREVAPIAAFLAKELQRLHGTEDSAVVFRTNREVRRYTDSESAFYPVSSAYSPDHIVYCKPYALYIPAMPKGEELFACVKEKLNAYQQKHGFSPKIIAVQGLGIFAWGTNEKNATVCADVFLDACKIGVYSEGFGGPLFMTPAMIDFICNWEVEAYRSKVSQG